MKQLTGSTLRTVGLLFTLLGIGFELAAGASIGLFSTEDCSSCNLVVPSGGTGTFFVSVLASDLPTEYDGFTIAEFSILGLPSGWSATAIPNPSATIVIGDPLASGTDIAFGQVLSGDCINLFRVEVTATSPANEVRLRVAAHQEPADPSFQCPFVWPFCGGACDPPPYCVSGGTLFVNSASECTVGTQPSTWSEVKRIYE